MNTRIDKQQPLRPSIFDRLIDDNPGVQVESEKNRNQLLREMRASVRRDLERLLNTRARCISPPETTTELARSLVNYGLPDLSTTNMADKSQRAKFCRLMESTIREFEPRFKTVKVSMQENKDTHDRTVRFRIDALLYADPAPETIVFDSVLEPIRNEVNVTEVS